jgi:hypothetical protein
MKSKVWLSVLGAFAAAFVPGSSSLSAATHYVSLDSPNPTPPFATWDTAATNIQDAVDLAMDGDTVLVTNGVYSVGGRETLDEDGFSIGSSARVAVARPITLLSVNGPEATKIVGSRLPASVGREGARGIRCVFLGANAVLSGFTLTNGTATRAQGAGVYCETGAVVTNCILTGNLASFWSGSGAGAWGGTLYNCALTDNTSSVVDGSILHDCTLTGGQKGAVFSTLYNCTLKQCAAAVMQCTLYDCTLSDNAGYDDYAGGANGSVLYNCTLTGNSGWGGTVSGCDLYDCTVANSSGTAVMSSTLYNCIVKDNPEGGVFQSAVMNCVVVGNGSNPPYNPPYPRAGGGVELCVVYNSIVYDNSGGNYDDKSLLHYCCTTPLPTNGIGIITGPPLFMDMVSGDFRLQVDSPCIDAGTNLVGLVAPFQRPDYPPIAYDVTTTDILGTSRSIDGNGDGILAWDIGAYEFIPESLAQVVEIPDPGLLAAIRVALNRPTGDLTVADLESLTELDASRQARGPNAPLIQSLQGLQAARNLTRLDLGGQGGPEATPNLALNDFSRLAGLANLTELQLADNGLTQLTLPEGLANLRYLNVLGNPITYLAVPKSMDLTQLVIEGFPIERVTVLLQIGPAMVEADGKIRLPIEGMCGQRVKLQRSENLVDWEDWQTMTLGGNVTGCGLIDATTAARQRFYRVVEDRPTLTDEP